LLIFVTGSVAFWRPNAILKTAIRRAPGIGTLQSAQPETSGLVWRIHAIALEDFTYGPTQALHSWHELAKRTAPERFSAQLYRQVKLAHLSAPKNINSNGDPTRKLAFTTALVFFFPGRKIAIEGQVMFFWMRNREGREGNCWKWADGSGERLELNAEGV